ncbi:hemerythrin domain-containing protein [Ideonella sp.]|uniref:hemerythrin domain-containing protein n=1 Tax=Ideonella sp. TaxID=1929293 RepID=UPI002B4A5E04|nr:hemerythrin domain-containing protein [Ideonella sp.]HJV71330.1 hemerythrin domain-containing protein [Ideonella sp.]
MPTTAKTDAIKMLMDDHKAVKALFDDYEKLVENDAEGADRQALATRICTMLTVHATLEEELFYPLAREALGREADLIDEATVEHATAKDLIAQIEAASSHASLYDAKVTVLGEYIQHHVKEEEREIFPKVKKTELDLRLLGGELARRKAQLMATTAASRAATAPA